MACVAFGWLGRKCIGGHSYTFVDDSFNDVANFGWGVGNLGRECLAK